MSQPPTWDRVQALFTEALELEPEAREALLARTEAAEPELAREVASLLDAHREAGGFLAGSAMHDLGRTAAPGDRIGPYRILGETGRGGMGVVFRAVRDDADFRKEVAIKLIDPGLRSDDILRRFRSERQILAMLDHPFIARLVDGGTAPDGAPFLAMEFVDGKPLTDYCDDAALGIDARLDLFLDVCDAVQFAHQRLVIHRDLKPANILVTRDGTPRLLDFGIAKLLAPEAGGPTATVTAPMNRLLTPDYASPEQVRGDPVTVAGDVYSLGVILYELLSGRRPLQFATRTPEEILRVIAEQDPPRPSTAAARAGAEAATQRGETTARLRRRLAGDLDVIVLKALERDPARRYGTVEQLALDLRRYREGRPVLARGGSSAYLLSRFVRRNRAAVVTASLITLSLIAGLAATAWQAGVARRERDRANRRFEEIQSLAHAVMFDIHDAIIDLPGSTRAREILVDHALRYLNGLSAEAAGDPKLQHELGVAYAKIADVQGRPMFPNLGRTTEALASYRTAQSILAAASTAWPDSLGISRDLVVTTQRLADLLRKMGHHEEAMNQARAARQRIEAEMLRHPDDPWLPGDLVVARDRIGEMKLAAADTAGALAEQQANLELSERMYRKAPDDTGWRRGVMIGSCKTADLLAARNDRTEAEAAYARSLRLAREAVAALGQNTEARRDLSIVCSRVGTFLARGGELDSALVLYDEGMRITAEMAAEDPRNAQAQADLAVGHLEIGSILMDGGRCETAEARFREAFDRFSRLAAADTGDVESRLQAARSSRRAGEACASLALTAPAGARPRWRTGALDWFERSAALYAGLDRLGALTGEDAAAPGELAGQLAELRAARR